MVKLDQALILDPPSELHFKPPFTDVTTSYLKLTNPTELPICFKLKTTAPKTYCVRPNSGVIRPMHSVSVAVMLQPITAEAAESMKHKFMVQSLFAPEGECNQDTLWRQTTAENLMNSKLRCVFDFEHSSTDQQDGDSCDIIDARNEDSKLKSASDATVELTQTPSPKTPKMELKKARDENKYLSETLKDLRSENASYKEEHLRWRRSKATPSFNPSESMQSQDTSMVQGNSSLLNKNFIMISIFVLIGGIIVGMKLF